MVEHDRFVTSRAYVPARCGKWYAWHDFTPGTTPTLYVTGECAVDMPGVRVVLRRAASQGSNPRILALEKAVSPTGAAPDAGKPMAVRYDEATVARYTQVSIQPDDVLLDVVLSL